MDFRKWVTVAVTDKDNVNWRDPYMISKNWRDTVKSVDGNTMLVSYNEVKPTSLNSVASCSEEMSRSDVEALLLTEAWYVAEEV